MTDKQKNLVIRSITGVFFVMCMVSCFLNPRAMVILFALITGLSIREYCGLVNPEGECYGKPFHQHRGGCLLLPCRGWFPHVHCGQFCGFRTLSAHHPLSLHQRTVYRQQGCHQRLGLHYALSVVHRLAFLDDQCIEFRDINFRWPIHYDMLLPLSIFIFLRTNDTGVYCSGSLFGKHKLFPRISPAKSWEGSIGGGIFVLIAAGIIGYIANDGEAHRLSILGWEGLGPVVVFFGTWGDPVESLFKRTLGVKDSGNILPGHGGMLDRFDSSLMAIPAAVIYLYTIQLFG